MEPTTQDENTGELQFSGPGISSQPLNEPSPSGTITSSEPGVRVFLVDQEGAPLTNFNAQDNKDFVTMAEDQNFEIPSSCRSGACFVCAAKVLKGAECIDIGKMGVPLVDIDEDQILTCIGGIKSECFKDGKVHEVVLEKLL